MDVTIQQVEEFVETYVWKELVAGWQERRIGHINEILSGLSIDGKLLTENDIHYRRGQIEDLEFSIIQPRLLIEELMEKNPEPKLTEEDDG